MQKIIIRTLLYHWLFLIVGLSVGFIINAEWLGYKSLLIERSINNIFFQESLTPDLEKKIKEKALIKIYTSLGYPAEFEILGEVIYYNDEFYWCKYKFRDKNDKLVFGERTTRVRWKTWEYYYGSDKEKLDTNEKNSSASKKLEEWHLKIRDSIREADRKEMELLRQESLIQEDRRT
jgi:hypothetical protein